MLRYRILTALILIPLVLWAVIALSGLPFALVCAAVLSLGALEWTELCQFQSTRAKFLFLISFFLLLLMIYWLNNPWVLLLGALLWLAPLYWVFTYQENAHPYLHSIWVKAALGLLVLPLAFYSLVLMKQLPYGAMWIILLFILVWSTDTFAYFAGRKWGKTPLAPLISPKKTMAGFWGGLLGAMFVAVLSYAVIDVELIAWLSIAFITILLAVLGDLFESLLKRLSGVKDSGKLLPGHGGLLDRVDSLLSTLPFYAVSLAWITHRI